MTPSDRIPEGVFVRMREGTPGSPPHRTDTPSGYLGYGHKRTFEAYQLTGLTLFNKDNIFGKYAPALWWLSVRLFFRSTVFDSEAESARYAPLVGLRLPLRVLSALRGG